jgi:outer membrane autotransporter protein
VGVGMRMRALGLAGFIAVPGVAAAQTGDPSAGSTAVTNVVAGHLGEFDPAAALTVSGGQAGQPAVVSGPVGSAGTPSLLSSANERVWAKTFGIYARTGADALGPTLSVHGAGGVVGFDRLVDPSLLLGLAVGFTASRADSITLRSDANSYSGNAYAAWSSGPFEINGLAGVNWNNFSNTRTFPLILGVTAVTTSGSADGLGFVAAADIGYRYRFQIPNGQAYLKPLVGVRYSELDRNAAQEVSPAGTLLLFPRQAFDRFATITGVDLGATVRGWAGFTYSPEARIGWTHDFIDPSPFVFGSYGGLPFGTRDPEPGRDAVALALQVSAWQQSNFQIFTAYYGEFRENAVAHQGQIGFRLQW